MQVGCRVLIALLSLTGVALAGAGNPIVSRQAQETVDRATLLLLPAKCAGVIVGDASHAITAAHCIDGDTEVVLVELHDGSQTTTTVSQVDRQSDVALLTLGQPASVTPLELALVMPRLGDALYFGGRRDRQGSQQIFAVLKIGQCPSLPSVHNAIFTNLRARKGDSGAPLVNRRMEVVGLVHGGATCNIAAPLVGLADELGLP